MRYLQLLLLKAEQAVEANQHEQAILLLKELLELDPENNKALLMLGSSLGLTGNHQQAVELLEKAAEDEELMLEAGFSLAFGYNETGQPQKALDCLLPLLEKHPQLPILHHYKAKYLEKLGRREDAEQAYLAVLEIAPDYPDTLMGLANLKFDQHKFEQSEHLLLKLLQNNADHAGACNDLARIYRVLGRIDEALALQKKVMQLDPKTVLAASNYLFNLCNKHDLSAVQLAEEHFRLAEQYFPTDKQGCVAVNRSPASGKIRIGYLSGDFRRHSVVYFIEGILQHHNYNQFELFCYSTVSYQDDITARIKALPVNWRNVCGLGSKEATRLIAGDNLDILVDLAGHSAKNRIDVVAQHPARLVVSWIGYPHSTGLKQVDYYISDHNCNPPGNERFYSEKLFRLPRVFSCWQQPEQYPPVQPPPFTNNGYITFGCFNNFSKVNSYILNLWADILNAVPDSRLYLKAEAFSHNETRERLYGFMAGKGIEPHRLQLEQFTPAVASHLQQYNNIDIALDTWPYNGTTTTCEAFWMGVPVITLAGEHHISRVGLSFLKAVGLPELVTDSAEEYVACAVNLAGNRQRLQDLKAGLRQWMTASPLMDTAGVTRELEAAYMQMLGQESSKIENTVNPANYRDMERLSDFMDELAADVYPELPTQLHSDITERMIGELRKLYPVNGRGVRCLMLVVVRGQHLKSSVNLVQMQLGLHWVMKTWLCADQKGYQYRKWISHFLPLQKIHLT